MRMLLSSLLAAQLAFAAGCGGEVAPVSPEDADAGPQEAPSVQPSIRDGAHDGPEGFYFLPPLVEAPDFDGTFDPDRSPTVEICELAEEGCGAEVATFTRDTGPGSETVRVDAEAEHYVVNWHTDEFDLEAGQVYRIRVLLEGREAGHADVVAVTSGKEMKNAATDETIALKDGRTLPVKFRIEEELVLEFTVPAVTPDSVPDAIYNPEDMDKGMLLDIVMVVFAPGSSQADRQAAVDSVNGEVVGGKRVFGDDGFYFVQIEHDGTSGPLFRAINRLNSLPQVEMAAPEFVGDFNLYLTPVDGSGFEEDDWNLTTANASADNWGLERIASPLAWGCSVGASETKIGVVDNGFHSTPDLDANTQSSFGRGVFADSVDHGNLVAAVLGARGNNGDKITGAMWQAGLNLFEYGIDSSGTITRDSLGRPSSKMSEMLNRVSDAAKAGAAVINLSTGADTAHFANPGPSASVDDVRRALGAASIFYQTVSRLRRAGHRPLFVLAAGNGGRGSLRRQGINAYWSAFPIVQDSFPNQILVVAASEQNGSQDALAAFSNHNGNTRVVQDSFRSYEIGQYVEISAPGVGISTLDGSGNKVSRSGTSVATPYVSGVAGLLESFDPRLSAAEIKDKIIDGAERGGRSAGGFPLLNAHEALKAAAEETGAPLCGNRLWIDDGQIATERDNTGTVENLAPVDGEVGALMEALHGGKFLWYGTPSGDRVLHWELGSDSMPSWTSVGLSGLPSNVSDLRSGTDASVHGMSHDRDTTVLTDVSETATLWWFEERGPVEAPLERFTPSGSDVLASISVRDLPFEHEEICIERLTDGTCTSSILATRNWFFRLSYPQHDRTLYSTVSPVYFTLADSVPWETCTFDENRECREITLEQKHAGTLVYEVDVETGGVTKVDSLSQMVFWLGQSESRPQQVLGRGTWIARGRFGAEQENETGDPEIERTVTLEQCAIEYRRQDGFTVDRRVETENACFFTLLNFPTEGGAGTFAPSVVGGTTDASGSVLADGTYVPDVIGPVEVGVKETP